jgi:hypothetical protein
MHVIQLRNFGQEFWPVYSRCIGQSRIHSPDLTPFERVWLSLW